MKRLYFTMLCAVLSLSGCVDSGEGVDTPVKAGHTVIKASTEQLVLNVGPEELNGVLSHTWSVDQAIGAFGSEGGENAKYSLFSSDDGLAEGQFFGAEIKGNIYAYYPYNKEATANGSQITISIPDRQTYNADLITQYEQNSKIFVARSEGNELTFGHLYGVLAIDVAGDFTVSSIKLTSDTEPLAGRVALDFENNMQSSAVSRSLYELTLDCGGEVATSVDNPTRFYVMLPPATYTTLGLEITTNKGVLSKRLMGSYAVQRVSSITMDEQMSSGTIEADFATLALEDQQSSNRVWESGAQIGIFSQNSNNTKYTINAADAGERDANFVGMTSQGAVTAYYPYSSNVKFVDGKLLLVASDTQLYNADFIKQFDDSTPFMIASGEEGERLSFKYVTGVLRMRISANMEIKYIEVSSLSKPLAGRLWVDTTNKFVCSADEVGSKSTITIDASAVTPSTTIDNPQSFYAMLPAGEYDDLQVTITSKDGNILSAVIDEKVVIESMDLSTVNEHITYQTIDVTLEDVGGGKSEWNAEDQVAVYSVDRGRVITSGMLAATGSLKNRVIAVGIPEEEYNIFYPASALTSPLDDKAVIEFPAEHIYNEGATALATQIYAGKSSEGKATLYHVNSLLAINVTATYTNCTLSSLTVTSKENPLAGTMVIEYGSNERPTTSFTESSKSIRVLFEEPIALSAGTSKTFYVAIPVGLYTLGDLTITAGATQGATVEIPEMIIQAEQGIATDINLSTVRATNLSAGEKYANTFVMPNKRGWYMFDAKIRGGYDKDEDGNAVITPTAVAGCLFEKNSGMITNVGICNEGKSISFHYDGSKGNASVATFDDGAVLWAWYLWCPAEEQPEDIAIGSNYYMDRNLGSYNVPTTEAQVLAMTDQMLYEAGGLYFQWGRPSPFPTIVQYKQEEWDFRMGTSKNDISQRYNHPSAHLMTKPSYGAGGSETKKVHTSFYCSNNVYWNSAAAATKAPLLLGCYLNTNDGDRWWDSRYKMNPKDTRAAWNYSVESNKQYDPCPYGYEVPDATTFVSDMRAFNEGKTFKTYQTDQVAGVFKGGHYYQIGDKLLWNGVTGARTHYGLWGHIGSANMTLATVSSSTNNHIRIYWGYDYKSEGVAIGSSAQGVKNWTPSMALSIRCIKKQ